MTELEQLVGGQGEALRAGPLVLKPVADPAQATWLAELLDRLDVGPGLRVVRPVRASTGSWVVDGWSAWRWLDGEHRRRMWDEVLEVSGRFHQAVADVAWSPVLVASHRWAVADRVAWGEADAVLPESVQGLLARRMPVDLAPQLIHADLGGNVLFDDVLAPAVIDVSPYWRPAGYADAIVVADAVAWEGAGDDLVERLLLRQGEQLLLRAVLFRVAVDHREAEAHQRVVALLEA
ncbi:MAG: hypothetical protein U0Q07_18610 [Acidimicrobiales bacterium]